ncbi:terpenoid synthase [Rhizopogon salebrosus TDB-379]|nr:terpenoid synthase [Rhizopogon salebrosus TDB-379]
MSPAQPYPLLNAVSSALEAPWSQANESLILAPFTYITSRPGKETCTLLIEALNVWLAVPHEQLTVIRHIVRMLHSASLMIDDIEDGPQLRRGRPVAHKVYGIPQTINSANYVYFLAYKELAILRRLGGESAARDLDLVVTEELLNVHRGQGLEIVWRDLLQCPTEEEYISMVNNKTGGLYRMGVRLMMAYATKNRDVDFIPLVNVFGVYYQIRDDYMNLQSTDVSLPF